LIVDFCVSIERGIGNGIQPQMMPDRSAKTGRLDRTKECICEQLLAASFKVLGKDKHKTPGWVVLCLETPERGAFVLLVQSETQLNDFCPE